MTKKKAKRGRPATARGAGSPAVLVRLSEAEAAQLDDWRETPKVSRAEYLRQFGLQPTGRFLSAAALRLGKQAAGK